MLRPIPFDMLFLTKDLKRTCYEISSLAGNTKLGKNTLAESYISFSACFIFQTYSPNFFKLFSFFFWTPQMLALMPEKWKMLILGKSILEADYALAKATSFLLSTAAFRFTPQTIWGAPPVTEGTERGVKVGKCRKCRAWFLWGELCSRSADGARENGHWLGVFWGR